MIYEVSLDIQKPVDRVVELFVDQKLMKKWEPGLIRIIETKGHLFDSGSEGVLVFDYQEKQVNMKTTVEFNQLPKKMIIIYEMMGTWNRCISHFTDIGNDTTWKMEVEFRFDQPNELQKEKYIEQTRNSMIKFKKFVEDN